MSPFGKVVLFIALVSFVTFVGLFGQLPGFRKTPIGLLQRLLCIHIPKVAKQVDQRATGGRISHQSKRLGNYLFYKKNPVVLVRRSKHKPWQMLMKW